MWYITTRVMGDNVPTVIERFKGCVRCGCRIDINEDHEEGTIIECGHCHMKYQFADVVPVAVLEAI